VIAVHLPDDSFAVFRKTTYNRAFQQGRGTFFADKWAQIRHLKRIPAINIALAHNVLNYSNIAGLNILRHLELF
jgi:hypothetical protein